jgi:hypothetical protein
MPAAPGGADLKPLIPRTNNSIIHRAEEARDRIHSWLESYCKAKGLEPQIIKSTPYSPLIWVQFNAWNPSDPSRTCTDRSLLYIVIQTRPFHRYEILFDVTLSVGTFSKVHTSVYELNPIDIERLIEVLLKGNVHEIQLAHLATIRKHPLQLWRPKNKVGMLDTGFADVTTILGLVILLCFVISGVLPPVIVFTGPVAAASIVGLLIVKYIRAHQRWQFQNQGKPPQEPRNLSRLDSWQTLVFEIGHEVGNVRQEILAELRKASTSGFIVETETIWYWGLDGKEEREQIVARFRRGISFVQVYAYGQDLFVGWDTHINVGTWVEKEVARGFKHGQMLSLRTVVAGRQNYTEYDLFDTNCLVEWVHGAVTKVVKRKMEHHNIDQEIDFKIIRGDRKVESEPAPDKQTTNQQSHSKFRQLFRRLE